MGVRILFKSTLIRWKIRQVMYSHYQTGLMFGKLVCYTGKCRKSFPCLSTVLRYLSSEEHGSSELLKPSTRPARVKDGPGFDHFLNRYLKVENGSSIPYITAESWHGRNRRVYFDVYGCQMNVNDTEVVWSILKRNGFLRAKTLEDADVVLVVTCAIREGAESKVWGKLSYLRGLKSVRRKSGKPPMKIGVLGCMAERLKERLLEKEKSVDLIAGPDSYNDLPRLLALTENDQKAVNVLLSFEETYADVVPVRLNQDSVTAFVSVMRGCDNMCSYCIVPFTRGRERSRPIQSIVDEVGHLSEEGVKEITLLGQNVNSYRDISEGKSQSELTHLSEGFHTVYKPKKGGIRFAELLYKVSLVNPEMRVRFTSPHPKDFPDEVLHVIRERPNVCKSLHLPAQSGSSTVLERMGRGYTREAYIGLVNHVKEIIPQVTLSSDFICGFCNETDEEFSHTLELMALVEYNVAFIFPYSMREKTRAFHRLKDDVPHETKVMRVKQLQSLYRTVAEKLNQTKMGQVELVLVEGESKRSAADLCGRNDGNIRVIFPAEEIPESCTSKHLKRVEKGQYVAVLIESANSQILRGKALYHTTLQEFMEAREQFGEVVESQSSLAAGDCSLFTPAGVPS